MSERRRNLFILLVVVGLIGASIAVVATRETKLGLDLQGGVSLVYQGKPTKQQPTITQKRSAFHFRKTLSPPGGSTAWRSSS